MKKKDIKPEIYIDVAYQKKQDFLNLFKFFLLGIIIEVLIIGSLYFLIYSSFFKVKNIEILNNKQVSSKEVLAFLETNVFDDSFFKKILGFRNILIWENLYKNNSNLFIKIKQVEVKKEYLNQSLKINVLERNPFGIWCLGEKCFWFDEEGILFDTALKSEGGLIPIFLEEDSQRKIGIGSKILPDGFLKIFFENVNEIKQANLNTDEIIVNLDLKQMTIKLFDGPEIYLSLNFKVLGLKDVILKFQNENKFNQLKYIDFKIENRVYYK